MRNSKSAERFIRYYRVPEDWRKEQKLAYLTEKRSIDGVTWQELQPDAKHTWVTEGMQADFGSFLPMGTKEAKAGQTSDVPAIFKTYSGGVKANRDDWVYDFNPMNLATKVHRFIEIYNIEVDRWLHRGNRPIKVDDFVVNDEARIKWSETLKQRLVRGERGIYQSQSLRWSLYRPFCKQYVYFDRLLVDRVYQMPNFLPAAESETENELIVVSDVGHRAPFGTLITKNIPELHLLATSDAFQCFPFYVYDEDGGNWRENITDWALAQFQAKYGPQVMKRDIFHYVYAMLHHPYYRARYAENLKRELPRIPFVAPEVVTTFFRIGKELSDLHLNYEQAPEYTLQWLENRDVPFSWRVVKMQLSKDKTQLKVNESLTLGGIPQACFDYRLGNRSALEWVIDQYQVSTDKRSGITSDPNRADDEEYIARLVGRVITVSLETVRLVEELPAMAVEGEDNAVK